jgi:hypothetical protein
VPAFSLITLDDLRLRRDTPADTLDRLDVDPILRQLRAVHAMLRNAWDDPDFKGPVQREPRRIDVRGQVVSGSPGRPVPDLPREGFLATYIHTTPGQLAVRRFAAHRFQSRTRIAPRIRSLSR